MKAVDGAGHESEFVHSDRFVIDVTPPEPLGHKVGINLIADGSFEHNQLSAHWNRSGNVRHWTKFSKDGKTSVLVGGILEQKIHAFKGDKVQVIYWVAPVNDENTFQDNLAVASVEHNSQPILVQSSNTNWQRHTFYAYVTPRQNFTISFRAAEKDHRFLLDSVAVYPVSHDHDLSSQSIAVQVNPLLNEEACYVTATWRLTDPESGINEYYWAVGTVRGIQIIHL